MPCNHAFRQNNDRLFLKLATDILVDNRMANWYIIQIVFITETLGWEQRWFLSKGDLLNKPNRRGT